MLVAQSATPPTSETAVQPVMPEPLSRNCINPVGVPPVTVAVKVTEVPGFELAAEAVREVVVGVCACSPKAVPKATAKPRRARAPRFTTLTKVFPFTRSYAVLRLIAAAITGSPG